jgi:hypothetical protein
MKFSDTAPFLSLFNIFRFLAILAMKLPPENFGYPTPQVTTVYKREALTESKTSETAKTEMIPPRELRSSKRKSSVSSAEKSTFLPIFISLLGCIIEVGILGMVIT